jgi:ArsR family transcriptional regulator
LSLIDASITVNGRVVTKVQIACCPSVLDAPLSAGEAAELARSFAALADPARLLILSMLAAAPDGELCVCEFIEPLRKSQPTVSHHMKVLADSGLVTGDRRGKWVWYRIVPGRLDALRAALAPSRSPAPASASRALSRS